MIASPHNEKLKQLRRLHRRRERERLGRFVAEGEDLIAAAQAAGRPAIEGYRVPGCEVGDGFVEVEPGALAAVSTLGSGTKAIAVYEQRFAPAPLGPLCLHLHGLSDPGNVGACLRSAAAFGASCVTLGERCADPHSPKAVRASMGAIFAMPLARVASVSELPGRTVALVARAGAPLREVDLHGPVSLLVGAEREGLPAEVVEACDLIAHVPIASESLNAAMAATLALYEATMTRDSNRVRT